MISQLLIVVRRTSSFTCSVPTPKIVRKLYVSVRVYKQPLAYKQYREDIRFIRYVYIYSRGYKAMQSDPAKQPF